MAEDAVQMEQQAPMPETNIPNQEQIISDGAKISSKALTDLPTNPEFQKFVKMLNKNPSGAVSGFASMYIQKVREAGLNDLSVLMVAGSLIITGMVNMLAENGVDDGAATKIQERAMTSFLKGAMQNDRTQNGYTDSNTPADKTGRTVSQGPAEGSAPPVLGGQGNGQ